MDCLTTVVTIGTLLQINLQSLNRCDSPTKLWSNKKFKICLTMNKCLETLQNIPLFPIVSFPLKTPNSLTYTCLSRLTATFLLQTTKWNHFHFCWPCRNLLFEDQLDSATEDGNNPGAEPNSRIGSNPVKTRLQRTCSSNSQTRQGQSSFLSLWQVTGRREKYIGGGEEGQKILSWNFGKWKFGRNGGLLRKSWPGENEFSGGKR